MQLKRFIDDDDAVSPVIGVILMVAITVILAAVIATFVLGLGDQISNTGPQASFDFSYDSSEEELTITHTDGSEIEAQNLYVQGNSSPGSWNNAGVSSSPTYLAGSVISAGSSIIIEVDPGNTVRVTWQSTGEGQSSTLQQYDVPT